MSDGGTFPNVFTLAYGLQISLSQVVRSHQTNRKAVLNCTDCHPLTVRILKIQVASILYSDCLQHEGLMCRSEP